MTKIESKYYKPNLRALHQITQFGYEIGIVIVKEENGKQYIAKPLKFEEWKEIAKPRETTINFIADPFGKSDLTVFFLDWLRIAEDLSLDLGKDFSKEREALKYHLEDMRKIAFGILEKKSRN